MSRKALLLVVIAIMFVGNVWAADVNWTNGNGNRQWTTPANWSTLTTLPTLADTANIKSGVLGPIVSGIAVANYVYVTDGSGTQTLEVAASNLEVDRNIILGYGATDDGTLWVTGGTVDCNQHLFLGNSPGAKGRLHIDTGTVNVGGMFGVSWMGGDGYVQLHGGTLHTEQFAFDPNDLGGTASMDITAGEWRQEHFWQNEIRALVYAGKITAYGGSGTVYVKWDPTAGPSGTGQTIVTAVTTPPIIVKKVGGNYHNIQDALNDVNNVGLVEDGTIEVQDSGVYAERPIFPADLNGVILQAKASLNPRPTITASGSDPNAKHISMSASGQTLQGFKINFSGPAFTTDNNSTIIISNGGASTVRDCVIVGPATDNDSTLGWIMGITAVANIENVDISNCRIGVVCDLNNAQSGFRYSVKDSKFHNNHKRGINFTNCGATMDNCEIYSNGNVTVPPIGLDSSGNMLIDGNEPEEAGKTDVLITNSKIRNSKRGRNLNVETTGTVTVEDSVIMNAGSDGIGNDCILQRGGTLNLTRTIIHSGESGANGRACLNQAGNSQYSGGITIIDHCTLEGDEKRPIPTQWAIVLGEAPNADVTIKNSIVIAAQGLFESVGTIHTNFNDIHCSQTGYEGQGPVAGANDIDVDPFYIQTNDDSNEATYYAIQPYSEVINADDGSDSNRRYMGAKGPVTGYEDWPADLGGSHGVDFTDFALLALNWDANTVIPAGPNHPVETFEVYSGTGTPTTIGSLLGPRVLGGQPAWQVVPYAWYGLTPIPMGNSTITLLQGVDANSGYGGTKAMTWVYDVNVAGDTGQFSTELLTVLPHIEDMNTAPGSSPYNNLRIMLKRRSGNSPDNETYMYVKFLNIARNNPAKAEKYDIVKIIIGGSTATHPDEWYPWTINLAAGTLACPYGGDVTPLDMTKIGGIIFGIQGQPEGPWGLGKGTIDMDLTELVDLPACVASPVGDLTNDCLVNFEDIREFVKYWLMGKG